MAENASLLVVENLPDTFDSIKPKLALYFQNKRRSGGEVLEIRDHPEDKRKAILLYKDAEAKKKVLAKGVHEVDFKQLGVVKLQVRPFEDAKNEVKPTAQLVRLENSVQLGEAAASRHTKTISEEAVTPAHKGELEETLHVKEHTVDGSLVSVELYDEKAEEEKCDPRRFILTGFSEDTKLSFISVYIRSCSQGAEHSWEVLDSEGLKIVVTFKQDIDVKSFLQKCSKKKLQNKEIAASRLEHTDSVLVRGQTSSIMEDTLNLYFSNFKRSKGGTITSVTGETGTGGVIVTFQDYLAAQRVAKEQHMLCGVRLTAHLYYRRFQKALTGETCPTPTLPSKTAFPVNPLLLNYVNRTKKYKDELETVLRGVDCKVHIHNEGEIQPHQAILEHTCDSDSLSLYRVASSWESDAKQIFHSFLDQFKVHQLTIENEVWEKIADECLELSNTDLKVSFEASTSMLVLVGEKDRVISVRDKVERCVKKAKEELLEIRNTIERKVIVKNREELNLLWNLVYDKLEDVESSSDDGALALYLKGHRDKVDKAEQVVKEAKSTLITQALNLPTCTAEFLKSLDLEEFKLDHFLQNGIRAAILNHKSLEIVAVQNDAKNAEDKIKELLKDEVISLTPDQAKANKNDEWNRFFSELKEEVDSSSSGRGISITQTDTKITLAGFSNVVADVTRKLKGYLENKRPVTEVIPLKEVHEVDFIDSCMKVSEVPEIKAMDVTILPVRTQASPGLKVSAAADNIKSAVAAVEKQIALIAFEKCLYNKAGESKVLEKHQDTLKARAKEFGCMLWLTIQQDTPTALPVLAAQSYSHKLCDAFYLHIAQGRITKRKADALVCPLNGDLTFDNPIAQEVLGVGGDEIRNDCETIIKDRQVIGAGEVILTCKGKLPVKILIVAVTPIWGKCNYTVRGNPMENMYLSSSVHRCLQTAEENQCASIVLPALGCGSFGFPVSESARVVMKAILEYCESKPSSLQNLKDIYVIEPDGRIIQQLNAAVKDMASKLGQTNATGKAAATLPALTATAAPPVPVASTVHATLPSFLLKASTSMLVLVGEKDRVISVRDKVERCVKKAKEELLEIRNTIERKVIVKNREELNLLWNLVYDKLEDVESSSDDGALALYLKGHRDKVDKAEQVVKEAKSTLITQALNLPTCTAEFLKSLDLEEFKLDHFLQNGIRAAILNHKSLEILAVQNDAKNAEDKIKELLKDEVISLTPDQAKANKNDEWNRFFSELKEEVDSSSSGRGISITQTDTKITLAGFSNVVADVTRKLKGYLENKRPVTEVIPLKEVHEVDFIDSCMKVSEVPEIKAMDVTILPVRTQASPGLKVSAAADNIKSAVAAVEKQIALIAFEKCLYNKAGESKVLEKHQDTLKARAKEFGCMLWLTIQQDTPTALPVLAAQSYSHKLCDAFYLHIAQGRITKRKADALVCPLNGDLTFDNPIAQEVLGVGGDEIRNDCETIIKDRQVIGAGEVILTCKGKLPVKILIVAVTPIWGKCNYTVRGNPMENMYLSSSVHRCLQTAEENQCASIVLPALGCGSFGFPVSESARVVMKAILEYCESKPSSLQNLKDIYVIEPDGRIIQQLNAAVKDMASKLGQTNATGKAAATLPALTATAAPPVPVASTVHATLPSFLLKATAVPTVNVSGVKVTLKKGDVTKETVDAIVNSTNNSLNLDSGVSGAILNAAGSSVVDECTKLGSQPSDGVVCTGGGNLSCKHIIQMVGPTTAAGIIVSVEKVLQECDNNKVTSVAFPAIGTGRGGIKPKDSIVSVLKGFENYFSKSASTGLKSIFMVAFEQKVYDSFQDYFAERNLQSSGNTKATNQASAFGPQTVPSVLSFINQGQVHVQSMQSPSQVKIYNVTVTIKKGDITTETVKGIVNSTNTSLNLNSVRCQALMSYVCTAGVSGAIFKAAGSSVQDECKALGSQPADGLVVTSGGSLSCDFILHMVGPKTMPGIESQVEKALQECEKKQIATVSFPAIGTGAGGLSPNSVIESMLQGFKNHLSQQRASILKLIYIVVAQDKIFDEFTDGLKQWTLEAQDECPDSDDDCDSKSESEYEDLFPLVNNIEIKIGSIKVQAVCGDITKEKTDAIVNSTTTTLNLTSGVSGAILKAAGQLVVDECTALGAGNLSASQVATAMVDAVSSYVIDHVKPSLSVVRIVIFQQNMMRDFEKSLEKFKKVTPRAIPQAPVKTVSSRVQPIISNTSPTAKAVKYPVSTVEVYSTSKDGISKVKECIKDLIAEECSSSDIDSEHISHLLDAERQQMAQLCEKQQIQLEIGQRKITVSGKRDDVLTAALTINKLIQNAKERDGRKQEEKRVKKTVRWEMFIHGKPKALGSRINYELEVAYHKKEKTYVYSHNGKSYTVDMGKMQQADQKGNVIKLKRMPLTDSETAIIEQPESWTNMKNKDFEIIVLAPNSEEFLKISKEFVKSCNSSSNKNNVEVVQIERIQHLKQWQSYAVRKQTLDRKYPKATNERILYHGTTKDICHRINKTGFNRSFCGRNATRFGQGTYFAKEASYSCHNSYSNPDEKGHKYIYRARVITGKICQGIENLKEPTPVNPNDPNSDLCDCAVDSEKTPFVFVIFCDDGAYPEYLITFKIPN
ncbi:UNVERIFIED_CONTAM: hypothetical protein FKN15_041281 [Acipenser sinensis]